VSRVTGAVVSKFPSRNTGFSRTETDTDLWGEASGTADGDWLVFQPPNTAFLSNRVSIMAISELVFKYSDS
jgi:hypothetical protein